MVATAGAGPKPIPFKVLDHDKLTKAIQFCLEGDVAASAHRISMQMQEESGVERAVQSFHANLPLLSLPCDILEDRAAVWTYRKNEKMLKLSGVAAKVLVDHLKIDRAKLTL
jgi:hypothetical protein